MGSEENRLWYFSVCVWVPVNSLRLTALPGRLIAVGWVDLHQYQMLVHFGPSGAWCISHCICFLCEFTFGAFVVNQVFPYFFSKGWVKGVVFINDQNLGRYWNIGPQETLYLPGVWLEKGLNKVGLLLGSVPFSCNSLLISVLLLASCFSTAEMHGHGIGKGGYSSQLVLWLCLMMTLHSLLPAPFHRHPHILPPILLSHCALIQLQGRPHSSTLVFHRSLSSRRQWQAPWYSLLIPPTWAGTSMLTEQPSQPSCCGWQLPSVSCYRRVCIPSNLREQRAIVNSIQNPKHEGTKEKMG